MVTEHVMAGDHDAPGCLASVARRAAVWRLQSGAVEAASDETQQHCLTWDDELCSPGYNGQIKVKNMYNQNSQRKHLFFSLLQQNIVS